MGSSRQLILSFIFLVVFPVLRVGAASGHHMVGVHGIFIFVNLNQADPDVRAVIRHALIDSQDIFQYQAGFHIALALAQTHDMALFHVQAQIIDDFLKRFNHTGMLYIII